MFIILSLFVGFGLVQAQGSLVDTQLLAHYNLVKGSGATARDLQKSLQFVQSPEVQIPMKAQHRAVEENLKVFQSGSASRQQTETAKKAIENASQRLQSYNNLVETLKQKMGRTAVDKSFDQSKSLKLSQATQEILKMKKEGRSLSRSLREYSQQAKSQRQEPKSKGRLPRVPKILEEPQVAQ